MRKVTMVINYDLPLRFFEDRMMKKEVDLETYLHRVGRTGRFGDRGIAVNLINKDKELSLIKDIQKYYDSNIMEINGSDLKEVNNLLKKVNSYNEQKRQFFLENI